MEKPSLAERAAALRLPHKEIAGASGLVEETVGRAFKDGGNPLRSTQAAIEKAVEADELRLLAHLLKIHGCRLIDGSLPQRAEAAE